MQPVWKQRLEAIRGTVSQATPQTSLSSADDDRHPADRHPPPELPKTIIETELQIIEAKRMVADIRRQIAVRGKDPRSADWLPKAESALRHSEYQEERLSVWLGHLRAGDDAERAKSLAAELAQRMTAMASDMESMRSAAMSARLAIEFMDVAQVALPASTYGRILDRAKTQARGHRA